MKKIYLLIFIVLIVFFILLLRQNIAFRKDIEVNKILTKTEITMYLYDFVKTLDKSSVNYVKEFDLSFNKNKPSNAIYKMHYFLYSKNSLNRLGLEDYELLKIKDTIAFEYDIDDDGVDEIIGSNVAEPFFKDGYGEFYVLKKREDKYSLLAVFPVNIKTKKIYILEDKTNGLRDIGLLAEGSDNIDIWKAQYEEKNIYFDEDNEFEIFNMKLNNFYAYQYVYDEKEIKKLKRSAYIAEYEFFDGKKNNLDKAKIFWEYLYKDIDDKDDRGRNWAISFDLNQDGVDEIIGINDSQLFCGVLMNCFDILQKNDEFGYQNIENILFNKDFYKFRILKHKTNGFYDLYLFSLIPGRDRVLRYQKYNN